MSILSSALFSFGAKAASGLIFGGKEAPKEDSRKGPFQPTRVADVPAVTADELQQRQTLRELTGKIPQKYPLLSTGYASFKVLTLKLSVVESKRKRLLNSNKLQTNLAGRPVPGSRTVEPGSRPYERPSQYNTVDEAMEGILPGIMNPTFGAKASVLMDKGLPATAIAESILVSGFAQGKFTPDLASLIALPVYSAVMKSVELVGGKVLTGSEDQFKTESVDMFEDMDEEKYVSPEGSFMSMEVPDEV